MHSLTYLALARGQMGELETCGRGYVWGRETRAQLGGAGPGAVVDLSGDAAMIRDMDEFLRECARLACESSDFVEVASDWV